MPLPTKTKLICLITILLLSVSTFSFAKNSNKKVLFTQTAEYAVFTPLKNKKNWYRLTLNNIHNKTIWFTDRPDRQAGVLSTQKFVNLWSKGKDSFQKNNPNGSLVSLVDNMKGMNLNKVGVFRLATPIYNSKTKTLSYDVYSLYSTVPQKTSKEGLHEVALFIDSSFIVGSIWCDVCPLCC